MQLPKFEEPNLHVLQMLTMGGWVDYASIKSDIDMKMAIWSVQNFKDMYRIVRRQMGDTVVY